MLVGYLSGRRYQPGVPPLTSSCCPLIQRASLPVKNSTASATSSTEPLREPSGLAFRARERSGLSSLPTVK
jgi:hypothetical protein